MTKPIHESDIDPNAFSHGERFGSEGRRLGVAAGGDQLGCSLYEVPPGRRAFPYHAHLGIEEAIYVLSGEGTIRLAGESHPLRAGSYVALLADGKHPHQLVNTGTETLRYLCMSAGADPEVVVYPDSGKVGVLSTRGAAEGQQRYVRFFKDDSAVGYFEGE